MKRLLLLAGLTLSALHISFAQNSVGIGTTTPDANAVLDLQSPTNNQGLLIPRVTTAQRTTMAGSLGAGQASLMVFDTDLNTFFFWNGTSMTWEAMGGSDGNGIYGGSGTLSGPTGISYGANNLIFSPGSGQTFVNLTTAGGGNWNFQSDGASTSRFLSNGDVWLGGFSTFFVDRSTSRIGIGTFSPSQSFDVVGVAEIDSLRINNTYAFPSTAGAAGDVLRYDGAGNMIWGPGSGDADWTVSGAGEVYNTTDLIGIGTATPISSLQIGAGTHFERLDPGIGIEYNLYSNNILWNGANWIRTTAGTGEVNWMGNGEIGWEAYGAGGAGTAASNRIYSFEMDSLVMRMRTYGTNSDGLELQSDGVRTLILQRPSSGGEEAQAIWVAGDNSDVAVRAPNFTSAGGYVLTLPSGLPPAAGDVLASDAAGNMYWTTLAGDSDWLTNGSHIYNGNAGNVGIGTSNPISQLTVNDPGNSQAAIYLHAGTATGTGATDGMSFIVNALNASIYNRDATPLNLGTQGSTDLTISGTGNVGIGTTVPSAQLHVQGNFRLVDGTQLAGRILTTDGAGNASWQDASTVSANIYNTSGTLTSDRNVTMGANTLSFNSTITNGFNVDGSTFSVDAFNNRVGIGTTTPARMLEVAGGWPSARFSGGSGAGVEYIANSYDDWSIVNWQGSFRFVHSTDDFNTWNDEYEFTPTAFTPFSGASNNLGSSSKSWGDIFLANRIYLNNSSGTAGDVIVSGGAGDAYWSSASAAGLVSGSGAATRVAFWSGTSTLSSNSNLYWDNTNSRLGVGTSSPAESIHTTGNVFGSYFRGDVINDKGTGQPLRLRANGSMLFVSDDNNDGTGGFTWYNNGEIGANIQMVLDDQGDLGIGTSTPAQDLHIVRDAGVASAKIESNGGGAYMYIDKNAATDFGFIGFMEGGSDRWIVGNYNGGGATSDDFRIIDWTNGGSTNEAFTIENDGPNNVGIGVGNPNYKLHVVATEGTYGTYIDYNQSVALTTYGGYCDVDNSAGSYTVGFYAAATNNNNTSQTLGARGYAGGSSTGAKYGVYGSTGGGGTRYAGYFIGDVYSSGTYLPSDQRLKNNISDFDGAVAKLKALPIKEYEYIHEGDFAKMDLPEGRQIGIMAQDIESIFPQLTKKNEFNLNDNPEDPEASGEENIYEFKSVNYVGLIPVTVKAIQEQQTEIDALKKENEELKSKFDQQQAEIDELKRLIQNK